MANRNHPNRNWRARMSAACDQWLSSEARALHEAPLATDEPARSQGLRNRVRTAYLDGYRDGRKRDA